MSNEEMMLMLCNIMTLISSGCANTSTTTRSSGPDLWPSHKSESSPSQNATSEGKEEVKDDNYNHARTAQADNTFGLLDPRDESVKDEFDLLERAYLGVKLGGHCGFPNNEGVGFSKEDHLHVGHLHQVHQVIKTAMKITILACRRHQQAYDKLNDLATALLYAMCLVLDARDEIWVHCHHGKEAFNVFTVLENSALTGDWHQRGS